MVDSTNLYSVTILEDSNKVNIKPIRLKKSRKSPFYVLVVIVALFAGLISPPQQERVEAFIDIEGALVNLFCDPGSNSRFHVPMPYQDPIMQSLKLLTPVAPGAGVVPVLFDASAMIRTQKIVDDKNIKKTPYEIFGTGGVVWTTYRGEHATQNINSDSTVTVGGQTYPTGYQRPAGLSLEEGDLRRDFQCLDLFPMFSTALANMSFYVPKILSSLSISFIELAYNPTIITAITDQLNDLISKPGGLKDSLYFPYLALIVMFGALYLAWQGLVKRRTQEMTSSAIWMILAVMAGSLFVYNPSLVTNGAGAIINEVNSAVLTGISSVNSKSSDGVCNVDTLGGASTMDSNNERTMRELQCAIWVTFVYTPWSVGQFGAGEDVLSQSLNQNDITEPPRVDFEGGKTLYSWGYFQLLSQTITSIDFRDGQALSTALGIEKEYQRYRVIDAIASPGGAHQYLEDWSGKTLFNRIGGSLLAQVAAGAGLIVIMIITVQIIMAAFATSFFTFFGVFFLLIGAHPGAGRLMANRWLELLLGTIMKRIVLSVLLTLLLLIYQTVISNTEITWLTSVLLIGLMSFGILKYKNKILKATAVDLGSGQVNAPKEPSRVMGMVGGAAIGAAGALAGAGVVKTAATQGLSGKAADIAGRNAVRSSIIKSSLEGASRGSRGMRDPGGIISIGMSGYQSTKSSAAEFEKRREQERRARQAEVAKKRKQKQDKKGNTASASTLPHPTSRRVVTEPEVTPLMTASANAVEAREARRQERNSRKIDSTRARGTSKGRVTGADSLPPRSVKSRAMRESLKNPPNRGGALPQPRVSTRLNDTEELPKPRREED